ncbi:MAG: helix-turn-helix transcriptional regulator [Acidobacteriota bacterium]
MTDESDIPVEQADEPGISIGQALRLLRQRVGISQTEAARRGGPDFRTISHWETGRKHPSLRLLLRYLTTLEFSLHDLQDALDQLAERPIGDLQERLTDIEKRVGILERGELSSGEDQSQPRRVFAG